MPRGRPKGTVILPKAPEPAFYYRPGSIEWHRAMAHLAADLTAMQKRHEQNLKSEDDINGKAPR